MLVSDKNQLDSFLDSCQQIVVYGAGRYARNIVNYIQTKYQNKIKQIVVTEKIKQKEFANIPITDIHTYCCENPGYKSDPILIATTLLYQSEIFQTLNEKGFLQICELGEFDLMQIDTRVGDAVPFQGLDFLLVGFPKCGTSTLHEVLSENDHIYLPKLKETYYYWFRDHVQDPKKVMEHIFFHQIKKGQLVGSIDTTFYLYAKEIRQDWGDNLKLIFLMRNPIKAAFSYYRMILQQGYAFFESLYEKYGEYTPDMFDAYCQHYIEDNPECMQFYDKWLLDFLEYFPKEQIHVMFFEEFVSQPKQEMEKLYEFLGAPSFKEVTALPVINEGNSIFKTYEGFEAAKRKWEYILKTFRYPQLRQTKNDSKEQRQIDEAYAKAEKIKNIKMRDKDYDKLKGIFDSHVRELENLLHKDLHELWF